MHHSPSTISFNPLKNQKRYTNNIYAGKEVPSFEASERLLLTQSAVDCNASDSILFGQKVSLLSEKEVLLLRAKNSTTGESGAPLVPDASVLQVASV